MYVFEILLEKIVRKLYRKKGNYQNKNWQVLRQKIWENSDNALPPHTKGGESIN
jgi:hypothetical protein